MSYGKGFLMKKMTFLFILPLLCSAVLVASENDTSAWAPKPRRAQDEDRVNLQKKMLYPQSSSRSPSPELRLGQPKPQRNRVLSSSFAKASHFASLTPRLQRARKASKDTSEGTASSG